MTGAELFSGVNDSRVFLYGDGSNKALYSGLDYNGSATAEYFPDLNVANIGDNAPITAMIRHYDRLLAFKKNATHSLTYGSITLANGSVTAGFYVSPVNRSVGSVGGAVLVNINPRPLDGVSIHEWYGAGDNYEQRSERDISQKVKNTLLTLDFSKAYSFFDKVNKEYYVVENGTAVVQNTNNGAWYVYNSFPAICMINTRAVCTSGRRTAASAGQPGLPQRRRRADFLRMEKRQHGFRRRVHAEIFRRTLGRSESGGRFPCPRRHRDGQEDGLRGTGRGVRDTRHKQHTENGKNTAQGEEFRMVQAGIQDGDERHDGNGPVRVRQGTAYRQGQITRIL
jgi:hypothetical protein